MENKRKGIGLLPKIIGICSLPMIVLGLVVALYSSNALKNGMQDEALTGLNNLCQSVAASYEAIAPGGDYWFDGETLYKGDYAISENESVIDSYVEGTDADVTLFFGDTRRATSLISVETGERILGTKASDAVIDAVLKSGSDFSATDITINNKNYYAYYKPLKNSDGSVVGMVFAGAPSEGIDRTISIRRLSIIATAIIIIIIAVIFVAIFIRTIVAVVSRAEGIILGLSNGELTINMNEKARAVTDKARSRSDEIGGMINSMYVLMEKLRSTVEGISNSVNRLVNSGDSLEATAAQTSASADEISHAIEDISKGAVTQSEDVESATIEINNMGALIKKIVEGVQELHEVSNNMKKADDESEQIITELGTSNDKTIEAIKKIDASVHTTNDSVGKIQEAINLITSIASETSLLALNASIEAARAGEAGRGFAVVASQISKLSEDSNNSAKTIENIINQLATDSESSVKIMAEVQEIINEQQKKLDETRRKFGDVSKGIDMSLTEMGNIYEQTKECDVAREKVTDMIRNLSAVSEENAASTEQTNASMEELNATINLLAEAARELKDIAEELDKEVSFFHV
ncbi:MAG: methyl-accepting chemotaxis protein [Clostridiales bacterium]|nr:methyl-accepting chemotaxis protein [Clostridiales bacterium]